MPTKHLKKRLKDVLLPSSICVNDHMWRAQRKSILKHLNLIKLPELIEEEVKKIL
jgi:hypothetical protein